MKNRFVISTELTLNIIKTGLLKLQDMVGTEYNLKNKYCCNIKKFGNNVYQT